MLILAEKLSELRFRELAEVYEESLRESASKWPDLPEGLALQMAEQDMYQYLKDVFFRTDGALYAIWQDDGRYVAALRLEPYRDGLLLAGLETVPHGRRKGYGSRLVSRVQEYLQTHGDVKLCSHVNKRNIPSRKTHEKCGFTVISDHAVYLDGSVDYRCNTLVYEAKKSCIG